MISEPYEKVKKDLAVGKSTPSFASRLIELEKSQDVSETTKKWVAGMMYAAGSDTTQTAAIRFILAMALHPDVQQKAQEELDRVVGSSRLPNLSDKDNLPYIECIFKEVLRWNIMTPLAAPHSATSDDEYEGYHIPKGAIIIPNCWALSNDPEMYPKAEDFQPERFMPSGDPTSVVPMDPRNYIFGFGRRICPGMHFAETVVWSTMVALLATTTIRKPLDEEGKECEPHAAFTGGLLSQPEAFECRVEIRSPTAFAMANEEAIASSA